MKKRKKSNIFTVLFIAVIGIGIIFFVGKSFALFNYAKEGSTVNYVTIKGLKVTILDGTDNAFNLEGAYPMYDDEGLAKTPLKFSIENLSSSNLSYTLKVVNDEEKQFECFTDVNHEHACPELSTSNIRYAYKIGNGSYSTPANLGANNDVVINSSISGGQELEISIVLWIDKDATNSIQGQYFFGKLILEGNKQ